MSVIAVSVNGLLPWPVFDQQRWSEEGPCTVTGEGVGVGCGLIEADIR